ncbi:hypothetical protein [Shewanella surugensis]|uniref:Uncharacterized protein n=1 Tax=Shewanella surugensis TaxID=212020 RepID=A0ABT0LIC9_9GAMM|nr:hypothetical protein [Shewanella surugensis]MCL1127451.1 hypothetical protein [Shewanella surugensis]
MKKGKVLIFSVGILSLFYSYVLSLSLTPEVSVSYLEYYIKNSTMFYVQDVPDLLMPMDVTLSTKELKPYFSRDGWSKKSVKSGRALLLDKGKLLFNLREVNNITTFSFYFFPTNKNIKLVFSIAGERFEKLLVVDNVKPVTIHIPKKLINDNPDAVNTLMISASSSVSLNSLTVKDPK